VAADVELWGHEDLPAALLGDEADLRARLRAHYGDAAGDEYDRVVITPPDHLMADRHVLDLGDRGVELVHLGRGHTDNDLVVRVPHAAVVYAGDLLEESAPPAYGGDSHPLDWPGTAAALVTGEVETFVPGHGDLMGRAAAQEQVAAISLVAEVVRALYEAGVTASDALAEGAGRWPFPTAALDEAITRAYAALARP
jgi:glyoxylase-like metal-dependent hydrolase (beta-lactamase superfamily II)